MSKQPPPAPTASAVGPCPTLSKLVGPPGTGSLPRTIVPPDHSHFLRKADDPIESFASILINIAEETVPKIATKYKQAKFGRFGFNGPF